MDVLNQLQSNGKAKTIKTTFSRETGVSIYINADKSIIWTLLTNASDFPRWNSTIISLEGEIKTGESVKLKSVLDPKRIFKIKVREMITEKKMIWGDGKGTRLFTLEESKDGSIQFTMTEKMSGLMFPVYAKYIPPFDKNFEQFANDLKTQSELIHNS